METNTIDEAKVAKLPQEGVHCFAANGKQINVRRIITVPLMAITVVLGFFFLLSKYSNLIIACASFACFVIAALVFAHTFLIAKYRIAVDYNEKKIILRYRYNLITIPFETFDAREGEPDRAEALLENSQLGGNEKVYYLVLDNVLDDACYQTTTKDLASKEDFFKLKDEAFAIADAYGARDLENAIKPETAANVKKGGAKEVGDSDIDSIVDSVMSDSKNKKLKDVTGEVVEDATDKIEEAKETAEEAAEAAKETASEAVETVKETAAEAVDTVAEKVEDIKEDIKE